MLLVLLLLRLRLLLLLAVAETLAEAAAAARAAATAADDEFGGVVVRCELINGWNCGYFGSILSKTNFDIAHIFSRSNLRNSVHLGSGSYFGSFEFFGIYILVVWGIPIEY